MHSKLLGPVTSFLSFCSAVLKTLILDEFSDEEAYLLLTSFNKFNNFTKRSNHKRLDFEKLSDVECIQHFRFAKQDILNLIALLQIPERYICENRTTATGLEGLLILLRRLTYPNRLCELEKEFGRTKTELSLIVNTVLEDIHSRFSSKITELNSNWIDLNRYAQAISNKGCPVRNCWGFIDGTCMMITRPSIGQNSFYSGHKRQHCVKFQGVTTPNGLIAHLFGPIEGCRHDSYMLAESKLLETLITDSYKNYCIYGDPAYPITAQLLAPYRGDVTEEEAAFNKEMSRVRQTVEWGFGKVKSLFAFLDFKKNLKLLLQPVSKYFIVGAFFTNLHTCLYGSQTSLYFDVSPPTLETYLTD